MTQQREEFSERGQRLRAEITERSQQDVSLLKDTLKGYWDRIAAAAEGLNERQADFKPGAEEFSLREMVHHFTFTVSREGERIGGLLRRQPIDDLPMGPGMMPEGELPPYPNVMRNFKETTDGFFKMLDGVDPDGNLDIQSRNNVIGPLNWREWIAWMLRHAQDHVQQAENIRAHPNFPTA